MSSWGVRADARPLELFDCFQLGHRPIPAKRLVRTTPCRSGPKCLPCPHHLQPPIAGGQPWPGKLEAPCSVLNIYRIYWSTSHPFGAAFMEQQTFKKRQDPELCRRFKKSLFHILIFYVFSAFKVSCAAFKTDCCRFGQLGWP